MSFEMEPPNRIVVCGVAIQDDTFEDAVVRMERLLGSPTCATVLFVNANSINLACRDRSFRRILSDATLGYCDGTGVRWAALARALRFHGNFGATDFITAFLKRAKGGRCYLLGTTPDGIGTAARYFKAHFPAWTLVGYEHGYSRGRDHEIVQSINAAQADLVLVGMGSPLQEEWIARNRSALRAGLAVGVGGIFDYWAGFLTRAPRWMIRLGLEWAFILSQQHHKASRYLIGNPYFVARTVYYFPHDLWENWGARALRGKDEWPRGLERSHERDL